VILDLLAVIDPVLPATSKRRFDGRYHMEQSIRALAHLQQLGKSGRSLYLIYC